MTWHRSDGLRGSSLADAIIGSRTPYIVLFCKHAVINIYIQNKNPFQLFHKYDNGLIKLNYFFQFRNTF